MELDNASLLITGGTGSFGKAFTAAVLKRYKPKRLIIFSRDEFKQYEMAQTYSREKYPCLRYFIGDVRDYSRLHRAFEEVDVVVHAAALKQVTTGEYNPMEFIKTNIHGAENVINAALDTNVKTIVALSTDKACSPVNLYGATKLCSDKLFIAANNMKGSRPTKFSVVRYGNVIGSRGSVVMNFLKKKSTAVLPITHTDMTRFHITLDQATDFVFQVITTCWGGEMYVPKIPSYRVTDLARAIDPRCTFKIIGIKQGEKIHEEMISAADSYQTVECKTYFVILPEKPVWNKDKFLKHFRAKAVPDGFHYRSDTNPHILSVREIREEIKKNVQTDIIQ